MFEKKKNRLIYHYDAEQIWLEPWGENALRVRATKMEKMPEIDWALLERKKTNCKIAIKDNKASIQNGKMAAEISEAGKIIFYNQENEILLEEFIRMNENVDTNNCSSLGLKSREFKGILGGDYEISLRFESNPTEKLFGMGQYQQACLDLKGCDLELAQRNSQASVPFVLSSLGYGFLWNNPAIGNVAFGKNRTTWKAYSSKIIDYWIVAGDTPREIEEAYAEATGKVPMMPDFAMGYWQCKLRYQTQEELLEVAREYKRRGLPISVIVADYFHWPKQGEFKFDPVYWPDPDAMVAELKEMKIELAVSVWPTVDTESENYKEMLEKGFLIQTDRGLRLAMAFHGNVIHFDATNEKARKYVWEKVKSNYFNKGIQVFWLDESEPEYSTHDFDIYRYHLGSNMQIGNSYPMFYAKTFYEGMRQEGQEKIINLLRCAWAGSQRYGALVWSGDIYSSFSSLQNQIVAGLNMGIAGIPWWTTDIGGFHGGDPDSALFRELLVRWFEYATFCPVMRMHGDRLPKQPRVGMTGGSSCLSGAPNEVWSFGSKVYDICVRYLKMRECLQPYISQLMEEAHVKGTPVMRPLFYDFPMDKQAWEIQEQYMFGPDILVAPVFLEGEKQKEVYLPIGVSWVNVWTGDVIEGGKLVLTDTPLEQIPLFVKRGADVWELLQQ